VLGPQKLAPEAAAIAVEADRALDTAIRLDPKNSEAWALKSYVLPINRFADREALLKRAIAARPLDCGCEHHAYGLMLAQVGRLREAAREFKRAVDFQHLNEGLYEALGPAQYAAGDRAAALQTLAAGRKVDRRPHDFDLLRARFAIWDGDFAQADEILRPLMDEPDAQLMGPVIQALQSRDPAAISQEKDKLTALTQDVRINRGLVISLLASLGGVDDALIAVQRLAETKPMAAYRAFFDPAFGRSISEPAYWTTAKKLGLVDYWMTSRQRPDFCTGASAPAGCRSLG
jgi:tetratricopeptide (TPR) repeat protein